MDWTLFLSALISSTLLPGGSEALLLYKLHAGGDPPSLVATATVGNVLGMGKIPVDGCYDCDAARHGIQVLQKVDSFDG